MSSRILIVAAGLLALTGCSKSNVQTDDADKGARVTVSVDSDDNHEPGAKIHITGDTDTGKVAIKLPGGVAADIDVPEGLTNDAKFDIDGVGLYPGAKVGSIKVDAQKHGRADGHDATVNIGFSAPADAAAVADWYQQQFDAKKVAVRRSGETLAGKTADGDDFTLALTPAAGGAAGLLTIRDAG